MRKKMKSLKILTTALIASLFAVSSFADINLSGNGYYKFGISDDASGESQNYRYGRMRLEVAAGNDANGLMMRIRNNMVADGSSGSDAGEIDKIRAHFTVGGLKVSGGNLNQYTGLLGTYYAPNEFTSNGTVSVSGGNSDFSAWVAHETTGGYSNAAMKPDFIRYGLSASFQGINVNYVARPSNTMVDEVANTTGDWTNAPFSDVIVSGTFGGASVDLNISKSDALNSDALLARVNVPVGGLTVKLGYAKMEGGYQSQDAGGLLGEAIFVPWHIGYAPQGPIGGNGQATGSNDYTGLAVAGSMGNISYQVTGGSYDDSNAATSNGFYDIQASYKLDSSATLLFGMGRAYGKSGMGVEAKYSF